MVAFAYTLADWNSIPVGCMLSDDSHTWLLVFTLVLGSNKSLQFWLCHLSFKHNGSPYHQDGTPVTNQDIMYEVMIEKGHFFGPFQEHHKQSQLFEAAKYMHIFHDMCLLQTMVEAAKENE